MTKHIFFTILTCLVALFTWADCTVYYAGNYSQPKAYAWTAGGEMSWPGQAMTRTEYTFNGRPIFTITFSQNYEKIIFNENGSQTADLINQCGDLYDETCDRWVPYSGTGDLTDGGCQTEEGVVGVPAEYEGVMLQAFYWDSYRVSKYSNTKWNTLQNQVDAIGNTFDLIWLPPSGNGGGVGYYTKTYSNQSSDWGSSSALKTLIGSLHERDVKVIADIVVNHRQSSTGWAKGFTREIFGTDTFTITSQHICSNDEAATNASSDSRNLQYGAADTGDNDGGCRDLDHTSEYVQNYIQRYLAWMKEEMGYDGWRYDMVKGYRGKYVSMYNLSSEPFFSVGEYWDGSANNLKTYLKSTSYNTTVFDFCLKYKLNSSIGKGNYNGLAGAGMRGIGMEKYAVTFIDNHDTFERSDNQADEFIGYNKVLSNYKRQILQANAYILLLPGTPCVSWPHWYTFPDDIAALVALRKAAGIHSESVVTDESASSNAYTATITGHHGSVILRMGAGRSTDVPSGYFLAIQGLNMDIYASSDVDYSPFVITGVEDVIAPEHQAQKSFENGQIIIRQGERTYNILGQSIR